MLTLTASGDVSDYSDTSTLQTRVAELAGVDASLVSISVAAASVIITATIAVPASTTASAVQSALASELSSAAAASTALGITVEGTPTVVLTPSSTAPPAPPASGASDGSSAVTIQLPLLVVQVLWCWRYCWWWPVASAENGPHRGRRSRCVAARMAL